MTHLHVLIFRACNDERERSEHDVALATNVLELNGICQGVLGLPEAMPLGPQFAYR